MPEMVSRRAHVELDAAAFMSYTQTLMEQDSSAHMPSSPSPPQQHLVLPYLEALIYICISSTPVMGG